MNSLQDINTATIEGKALIAALAIITTECRTQNEPDQCVQELMERVGYMYPPDHEQWKKTGIALVAEERQEQIKKHGFTIEDDCNVNDGIQLARAAAALIDGGLNMHHACPAEWDDALWARMIRKPFKERLIMAAALLAAQVDVILREEQEFADSLKP